ncbi:MAG: carbohydrate porin [Alphaproteobacteria bacterium]|nr:carbohydrate porin [Alphaproteobacteria bacterium]
MKKILLLGVSICFLSFSVQAQELLQETFLLPLEGETALNQTFSLTQNDLPSYAKNKGKSVHSRLAKAKKQAQKSPITEGSWAQEYQKAKQRFQEATGISYTIDASILGQRGAPNGKITPWQTGYYGSLNWDLFQSERFGSGSIQASYTLIRYWNKNASILGNNIGVATPLNDYTQKANYFDQLSYTQNFAGRLSSLSVTLGQFPLYNFDGTEYNSNQQINFINEALSQNLTGVYATAGLGGYITWSPSALFSASLGFQDATNISGNRITTKNFSDKKFTSFFSATYSPTNKLGELQVSLLLYHQPSVEEQPEKTNGWSLNIQQNIGKKWAVFGRANGVGKALTGFNQSYMLGAVYNNPLNRNALDQIGFAYAFNKIDKEVMQSQRKFENVLEGYWSWGIGSNLIVTPDIQFYIHPALNQKSKTATVTSLRATFMF